MPAPTPPGTTSTAASALAYFAPALQSVLTAAEDLARSLHLDFVETEHLLAALLKSTDPTVQAGVAQAGIDPAVVEGYLMNYLEPSATPMETMPSYSVQVKQVLSFAVEEAQKALLPQAGALQLLLGLVRVAEGKAAHALARFQVTQASLAKFAAPDPRPVAMAAAPGVAAAPVAAAPTPAAPAQEAPAGQAPGVQTPAAPAAQQGDAAPTSTNILANFTTDATNVLSAASRAASVRKLTFIEPEHVLLVLAEGSDQGITKLLEKEQINVVDLVNDLTQKLPTGTREGPALAPAFSPRTRRLLEDAFAEAKGLGSLGVDPIHMLLALLRLTDGLAAEVLRRAKVLYTQVRSDAPQYAHALDAKSTLAAAGAPAAAQEPSALEKFGEDLTAKAKEGKLDAVLGRQHEIENCVAILSRRLKNNPVILGEPGVGKTALVEGLAQMIVSPACPEVLRGKRIISLNLTSIVSGASHRGEFEERMEKLLKEVKGSNGEIILFIDEVHNLLGAGDGAMSAANILKPALSRGELRMIGATTTNEYKKYLEKDPALQRRFQKVVVNPPTVEVTVELLKGLRPKYEEYHKVTYPDGALEAAARLSDRYINDRFLPDKAVDLMDEAAAQKHLPALSIPQDILDFQQKITKLSAEIATLTTLGAESRAKKKQRELDETTRRIADLQQQLAERQGSSQHAEVTDEDVMRVVATWTGIPVAHLRESEAEKLLKMEDRIHERVIGQQQAIHLISEAVRRSKAGLKNPKQPIGSFIFLGPTGVGKTELAKTVAEFLFGTEQALIRFDMSEFQEKHAVARLIGAPPGYVGYDEGGQLTEAVRARPYSVVLFDELEKAHPDIFDILLQLLDDGRLTDSQGRTVDFKNTIVICTSNIGARDIQDKLGDLVAPVRLDAPAKPEAEKTATVQSKDSAGAKTMGDALVPPTDDTAKPSADPNALNAAPAGPNAPVAAAPATAAPAQLSPFPEPEGLKLAPKLATEGGVLTPDAIAKIQDEQTKAKEAAAQPQVSPFPDAAAQTAQAAPVDPNAPAPAATPAPAAPTTDAKPGAAAPATEADTAAQPAIAPKVAGTITVSYSQILLSYVGALGAPVTVTRSKDEALALANKLHRRAEEDGADFSAIVKELSDDPQAAATMGKVANVALTKDTPERPDLPKELRDELMKKAVSEILGPFESPAGYWLVKMDATDNELPEGEDPQRKKVLKELKKIVLTDLQKFMRPEMINRFDEVCIFEPLTLAHVKQIVSLIVAGTQERLAEQEIYLEVSDQVKELLAKRGFDPLFGARPLKRAVQRDVDNVLSSHLIRGEFKLKDVIVASVEDGEIIFKKKETPEEKAAREAAEKKTAAATASSTAPADPNAPAAPTAPAATPADPNAVPQAAAPAPVQQFNAPPLGAAPVAPAPVAPTAPAFTSELPPNPAVASLPVDPPQFPSENPPVTNVLQ